MKRLLKLALLGALAAGLACLAGLAVLHRLYPPERLKAMALDRARRALGREIRIARLGLGPRGISLGGVEVSEAPDFGAGTFLRVDSIAVRPRLKPLLRKRLEVAEVVVSGLECRVVKRREGFNFSTIGGGRQTAATQGARPAVAAWSVAGLKLRRGSVRYEDKSAATAVTVSGIEASARNLSPEGLVPLSVSLAYSGRAGGSKLGGGLDFKGDVDLGGLDPTRLAVEIDALALDHLGWKAAAAGSVKDASAPRLDLTLTVPKAAGLRLSVRGRLALPAGKAPSADLRVESASFPLAQLAPMAPRIKDYDLQGRAELKLRVTGPLAAPVLSGTAGVRGLAAKVSGMRLSGLDGTVSFDPAKIAAAVAGKLDKGAFKLDMTVSDYRTAPDARLEGSLSELDLTKLKLEETPPTRDERRTTTDAPSATTTAGAKHVRSSGKLFIGRVIHPNLDAANAELHWSLTRLDDVKRLSGSAQFKSGEGRFDNLRGLSGASPLAQTLLLPVILLQKIGGLVKLPLLPAFDKVRFKEITGLYAFENGLMTVKESHMDSSAAYVACTGTADLANDRLNLRILTRPAARAGLKLTGPLGMTVTGSISNPSVKPDVAAILKQPVVNDAVKQGKKLLKGLLK